MHLSSPLSLEALRERRQRSGKVYREVAAYADGITIGWAALREFFAPGLNMGWLATVVLPEFRGAGIGADLYGRLAECAASMDMRELRGQVREGDDVSLGFAVRRGWFSEGLMFESELELTSFDFGQWEPKVEALRSAGYSFVRVSDLEDQEAGLRAIHRIETTTDLDIPGFDASWTRSYEDYARAEFNPVFFRPEMEVLAFWNGEPVGLSGVAEVEPHGYNNHTGVLPEHRGKGLGLATKLVAMRLAKEKGFTKLITNNHSLNRFMLAINEQLGYVRRPGWHDMVLKLEGGN